jgi:hypothetical protein
VTEERTTEVEIGADVSIDADKSYADVESLGLARVLSEGTTRDVLKDIDVILSRIGDSFVASTSTLLNVDRDVDEIRSSVCTVEDVVAMLLLLLGGRHGPALTS